MNFGIDHLYHGSSPNLLHGKGEDGQCVDMIERLSSAAEQKPSFCGVRWNDLLYVYNRPAIRPTPTTTNNADTTICTVRIVTFLRIRAPRYAPANAAALAAITIGQFTAPLCNEMSAP